MTNRKLLWQAQYDVDSSTGCWEWSGYRSKDGYGRVRSGRGRMPGHTSLAHRFFYELHVGAIPAKHDLHHSCENKGCVNPAHLVPLTRRDHVQGFNPHTKLTKDQADEIRLAMHEMCERYGVRPRTLAAIAEGRIWNG